MNMDASTGVVAWERDAEPSAATSQELAFDLFISFSASDSRHEIFGRRTDIASETKKRLEAFRHPQTKRRMRVCTYVDDFDLSPAIEQAIYSKLDSSGAVLVMCTPGAAASPYVKMELAHTRQTKSPDRLIPALIKAAPSELFPGTFSENTLAANISYGDLANRRAWIKRIEMEAAKVAARVWGVRLLEIYDRFVVERQRRRIRLLQGAALAVLLVVVGAGAAVMNFLSAQEARTLADHRRLAAEIASIDRAWNSAGDIDQAKRLVDRLEKATGDAQPFELRYFSGITSAEKFSIGRFANPVDALAIAPDGSRAVVATQDDPVIVFDPRDGRPLKTLSTATVDATAVAFADGGWLVAGTEGGIVVWNDTEPAERLIALPDGVSVERLALRPGDVSGVVLGSDGGIYTFNLSSPSLEKVSQLQGDGPHRVIFTEDGKTLATFTDGEGVTLLDGTTLEVGAKIPVPDMRFEGEFAAWRDLLFFSAGDKIGVLDTANGTFAVSGFMGDFVTTIDIHDSGGLLVIGGSWKGFELWQTPDLREPRTWRYLESLRPVTGWASSVHFQTKGNMLIGASLGGDIRGWDTSRIGIRSSYSHSGTVNVIEPIDGTDDIVSGDSHGMLRRWNPRTGDIAWERTLGDDVDAVAFDADAAQVLATSTDGNVFFLDAANGSTLREVAGWGPLARSQNGKTLAWIGEDGQSIEIVQRGAEPERARVSLTDIPAGEDVELDIVSLALSPGGNILAAGTGDGRLAIVDIQTRRIVRHRELVEGVLWTLAFSPDGKQIAAGGSDNFVRVVTASQLEDVAFLAGHWNTVFNVDFSPDGKTLVSAGREGVLRFWNTGAWQETMALSRHGADMDPGARVVAFDESGERLYSGGAMGRIIVWDTKSVGPSSP
ncbi:MAG: hypothetical protein B7Y90_18700 [Alphaproteobacteria bacterium 32-64-14]|nr:MAG: hypothetical protein B7Y90_18700 [Alphaproteobacteria bacterium 32-64-14]